MPPTADKTTMEDAVMNLLKKRRCIKNDAQEK
jgi:hypothetical protein